MDQDPEDDTLTAAAAEAPAAPTVTSRECEGDVYRIAVAGQIDLSTVPELKSALTDAVEGGSRHVLVDLADVRYMDSSGFGVLLGATKRLRPVGGALYLVGCTPAIERLLQITRLNTIFELYPSERAARQAVAAARLIENSYRQDGTGAPSPAAD